MQSFTVYILSVFCNKPQKMNVKIVFNVIK